ncbi:hypothetical protein CUN85_01090 [Methanolobus halotolerans]|uniref:Uncharacterized protein n=1 Tax=Methanolobus halotolerans TaxID=2052935 RepID=A0A4E0Q0E6_9EURY|nr:hypothetical protein CUN85_01090 [Methanolobus halotolerans]
MDMTCRVYFFRLNASLTHAFMRIQSTKIWKTVKTIVNVPITVPHIKLFAPGIDKNIIQNVHFSHTE